MCLCRVSITTAVGCLLAILILGGHARAHHLQVAEGTEGDTSVTQLLEVYECTRCHRVTTPHRLIGPSLWHLNERADSAAIRASILTPDAVVAPGYPAGMMRTRLQELGFYDDIARQPAILERLVAYLAGQQVPQIATDNKPSANKTTVHIASGTVRQSEGKSVDVPAFSINAAAVTKAQYAVFMANGGYTTKRYWDRAGWAVVVKRRQRTQPRDWDADRDPTSAHPVVGVSWYEAQAYCHWAGQELPSELQWQRACQEEPVSYGPGEYAGKYWEWTMEAIWKGNQESTGNTQEQCAARIPSPPALDGRHTGFRCLVTVHPTSSAISATSAGGGH